MESLVNFFIGMVAGSIVIFIVLLGEKRMKYQLYSIDARFECPVRDTWEEAAADAEAHKVGRYKSDDKSEFELDPGNLIKAVRG